MLAVGVSFYLLHILHSLHSLLYNLSGALSQSGINQYFFNDYFSITIESKNVCAFY
jgi:hypothetical protein